MNPDLTFWDHISLGLALLFVAVFIGLKIRKILISPSGGCGGCSCSSGACSAPLTKKRLERKQEVQSIAVASMQEKVISGPLVPNN